MIDNRISRRKMIRSSSLVLLGIISGCGNKANKEPDSQSNLLNTQNKLPFRVSLNTSTIRSYKLNVEEQIDAVANAGFDGIELWVNDVNTYLKEGGSSESLAERLKSRNLVLENMIGFSQWASNDLNAREQAFKQLQQDMEMTAKLGGKYIAAPVQGVAFSGELNFKDLISRFLTIVKLSDTTGVIPILELWGQGPVSQVAEGAHIVMGTGHPNATMLLDFYHMYRGGNPWDTLDYINCGKLPVIHINDFPDNPPYDQLKDSDRIFPGDGICPFNNLIPKLYKAGFRGGFSLELFNQGYWDTMDVETILKTGYDKTFRVLNEAMAGV